MISPEAGISYFNKSGIYDWDLRRERIRKDILNSSSASLSKTTSSSKFQDAVKKIIENTEDDGSEARKRLLEIYENRWELF